MVTDIANNLQGNTRNSGGVTTAGDGSTALSGLSVSNRLVPHVALIRDWEDLGSFDAADGWAAISNDTTGLVKDVVHILGTHSLEFDKVDGAANTTTAGILNTITSVDGSRFKANDHVSAAIYVSSVANIASAFIRIGTDASNYNQWTIPDTDLNAGGWAVISLTLASTDITVTGSGWDSSAITWVSVGTIHDAEGDLLADIRWDHLALTTAQLTTT